MTSRVTRFSIENQRGIRQVTCENVPPLMVIAGPNGAGKSTLLDSVRRQTTPKPIYVGPHRVSKRQTVQFRYMYPSNDLSIEEMFSLDNLHHYEGITVTATPRSAWDQDESTSFVKYGLCKIEIERGDAMRELYELKGEVKAGLPNPWQPLHDLLEFLLPHLKFAGIDTTVKTNIRCNFRAHGHDAPVDLDDLSSGEKSVIQLFYPLIEHQIKARLAQFANGDIDMETIGVQRDSWCVLIDEPELHLHPALQIKVLDYLRRLSKLQDSQVILTTQSTAMIENATFEELYLLRPAGLVPKGENQLKRVASDEERMQTIRELFGSAVNLTAMQPIIVVEGVGRDGDTKVVSDKQLFRNLDSRFDRVTVVPGGGKGEAIRLRKRIKEMLAEFSDNIPVLALVDRDTGAGVTDSECHTLPVSMIENFLVDPDVVFSATASVRHKTQFHTREAAEETINLILDQQFEDEIDRRIIQDFGYRKFQPKRPTKDLAIQVQAFCKQLAFDVTEEKIQEWTNDAQTSVAKIREENSRREKFSGKQVLNALFRHSLHNSGLSKEIFLYYAAKEAAKRESVKRFFDQFFDRLFPSN